MEGRHAALHPGHLGRHRHHARGLDVGHEPCESARARTPLPCTAADAVAQWPQIPRIDFDSHSSGQQPDYTGCSMVKGEPTGPACRQFDPPCSWDKGWYAQPPFKASVDVEGDCSGDWTGGQILDRVKIPKDLPPGDYVLGWRCAQPSALRPLGFPSLLSSGSHARRFAAGDCEESTQVWSSCADVTVVASQ